MPVEVPIVIVAEADDAAPAGLDVKLRAALAAWERVQGLRTHPARVAPTPATSPSRALRLAEVEAQLQAARLALDAADPAQATAERAPLAEASAIVRAHPEDPEAPLLLAELLRVEARIERFVGDEAGAAALLRRADRLDGGRALGLSESGTPSTFGPATVEPTVVVRWRLPAPAGDLVLRVDGRQISPTAAESTALEPGEHHVWLARTRDGALDVVDARWISVASPDREITLHGASNEDDGCDAATLASAARGATGNRCNAWVRGRRLAGDRLELSLCARDWCGPATRWEAPRWNELPAAPRVSPSPSPWPWVAAGAAVLAGGALAAWRLGAFDAPAAPAPVWHWGGVH